MVESNFEKGKYIFISYSHKDNNLVLPIIQQMQKKEYKVWYDDGIHPGESWDDYIADKIENSGYFIAMVTKNYIDSTNCKDEINFAKDCIENILLIYLEDIELPSGMKMRFNRFQAIPKFELSDKKFYEKLDSSKNIDAFIYIQDSLFSDFLSDNLNESVHRKKRHKSFVRKLIISLKESAPFLITIIASQVLLVFCVLYSVEYNFSTIDYIIGCIAVIVLLIDAIKFIITCIKHRRDTKTFSSDEDIGFNEYMEMEIDYINHLNNEEYDLPPLGVSSYKVSAYAKVNLFLRVCGKYDNGYHRLLMLMQKISLADDVEIEFDEYRDFGIELDCDIEGLEVSKNICYKSADKYYKKLLEKRVAEGESLNDVFSKFPHIKIKVTKNTPSEAGLGGGSSDAAAVLEELNKFHGNPFTFDEMLALGASLGADVPFFFGQGSTFCEGIGEILTEVPSLAGMHMILIKPKEGVPTGKCFNLCDEYPEVFDEDEYRKQMSDIFMDESLSPVERIKKAAPMLTNDLQKPAVEITPVISMLLDELKETAPVFSMMSGSGSCVFAIYENEEQAQTAYNELKENSKLSECRIMPAVTK